MPNFNQCTFIGHINKRGVELKFTANQTALAKFGLTVREKFGERDNILFVDCVCFGKRGEAISKHLDKGDAILVTGKLWTNSWESNGQKHSRQQMTVDNWTFVGGKKNEQPGQAQGPESYEPPYGNDDDAPPF